MVIELGALPKQVVHSDFGAALAREPRRQKKAPPKRGQ
jgi:hypothetical protein